MDEISVKSAPHMFLKVVSVQSKKLVNKVVSAERGISTTAVCCTSASGIFVPSVLIFTRKRNDPRLGMNARNGTAVMIPHKGFITTDLFVEWLKRFQKFIKSS